MSNLDVQGQIPTDVGYYYEEDGMFDLASTSTFDWIALHDVKNSFRHRKKKVRFKYADNELTLFADPKDIAGSARTLRACLSYPYWNKDFPKVHRDLAGTLGAMKETSANEVASLIGSIPGLKDYVGQFRGTCNDLGETLAHYSTRKFTRSNGRIGVAIDVIFDKGNQRVQILPSVGLRKCGRAKRH